MAFPDLLRQLAGSGVAIAGPLRHHRVSELPIADRLRRYRDCRVTFPDRLRHLGDAGTLSRKALSRSGAGTPTDRVGCPRQPSG